MQNSNEKIENLMKNAMSKIKEFTDVNTVVGKPIKNGNLTITPITKVTVGFVAGGGEYSEITLAGKKKSDKDYPFAGGSGAGMSITPVAFVSVDKSETKVFALDGKTPLEKILDMAPAVIKSGLEKLGIAPDEGSATASDVEPVGV